MFLNSEMSEVVDVLIWGAYGFTGRLVVEHFKSLDDRGLLNLNWAIGGRNEQKLAEIAAEYELESIPIIIGDNSDQESIDGAMSQTKVVINMIGPYYFTHGKNVVDACVRFGTHYCDITGEGPYILQLIEEYHDLATENGVYIVPACGFDSMPSDIGANIAVNALREAGRACTSVENIVMRMVGGVSGGTIESMLRFSDMPKSVLKKAASPNYLNPPDAPQTSFPKDQVTPKYNEYVQSWTAPFVMAFTNTRVVRRSAGLLNYGPNFSYTECSRTKGFLMSLLISLSLLFVLFLNLPIVGGLLKKIVRKFAPKPGEGPDTETRESGHWQFRMFARSDDVC
eukprot:TRINITY_DN1198_c1_g1_i3.p1 TRINITY_DN1198_c1_g1~~TRINITY_DN1198_c1_g1_i3.p1  ORF type:complete len:340 (-),score=71.94 TRINITY_DN1198_c1_g1_i3:50-1069(-)